MRGGLLDFIFTRLEVNTLSRKEVKEYLTYLHEIISEEMSPEDRVKFLACKVKLNHRLIELDKRAVLS